MSWYHLPTARRLSLALLLIALALSAWYGAAVFRFAGGAEPGLFAVCGEYPELLTVVDSGGFRWLLPALGLVGVVKEVLLWRRPRALAALNVVHLVLVLAAAFVFILVSRNTVVFVVE